MKFLTKEDKQFKKDVKAVLALFEDKKIPEWRFDMGDYAKEVCQSKTHKCGTSHCIGGWIAVNQGVYDFDKQRSPDIYSLSPEVREGAENLFHPDSSAGWNSNRKGAIRAMKRFLKGEKYPWDFKLKSDEIKKGALYDNG